MSILIIGIIAAVSSGIIIFLMQTIFYVPRELKIRAVGEEIVDTLANGTFETRPDGMNVRNGIRSATGVVDASKLQFTYTIGYPGNTDKRNVRIRWDSTQHKLFRSLTGTGEDLATPPGTSFGSEEVIPYYIGSDISIYPTFGTWDDKIFTYFKENNVVWNSATDSVDLIRRVDVYMEIILGSGAFSSGDSNYIVRTSIYIRQGAG